MLRGAQQATVHELARVGHNLATKPPPPRPARAPQGTTDCCRNTTGPPSQAGLTSGIQRWDIKNKTKRCFKKV